jgi:hypothetical protein
MTPRRANRWAVGLWLALAIVAWNALYDLRITLGVRDYLLRQALYEAGRGPAVTIAEAMQATVKDAVIVASLWATIIVATGFTSVRLLRRASG